MEESKQFSNSLWTLTYNLKFFDTLLFIKIFYANFKPYETHNDLLITIPYYFNGLHKTFKMNWDDVLSMIYILVKEAHFDGNFLLNCAWYEILLFWEKFEDEVKKNNERQEAENAKMEALMADMKNNMNKYSLPLTPLMPTLPSNYNIPHY